MKPANRNLGTKQVTSDLRGHSSCLFSVWGLICLVMSRIEVHGYEKLVTFGLKPS